MKIFKYLFAVMVLGFMTNFSFAQETTTGQSADVTKTSAACEVDDLLIAIDEFQKAITTGQAAAGGAAWILLFQVEGNGGNLSEAQYGQLIEQGNVVMWQTILDYVENGIITSEEMIGYFDHLGVLDEYENMVTATQQLSTNCTLNEEQLEQELEARALELFPPRNPNQNATRGIPCNVQRVALVASVGTSMTGGCLSGPIGCTIATVFSIWNAYSYCSRCC